MLFQNSFKCVKAILISCYSHSFRSTGSTLVPVMSLPVKSSRSQDVKKRKMIFIAFMIEMIKY